MSRSLRRFVDWRLAVFITAMYLILFVWGPLLCLTVMCWGFALLMLIRFQKHTVLSWVVFHGLLVFCTQQVPTGLLFTSNALERQIHEVQNTGIMERLQFAAQQFASSARLLHNHHSTFSEANYTLYLFTLHAVMFSPRTFRSVVNPVLWLWLVLFKPLSFYHDIPRRTESFVMAVCVVMLNIFFVFRNFVSKDNVVDVCTQFAWFYSIEWYYFRFDVPHMVQIGVFTIQLVFLMRTMQQIVVTTVVHEAERQNKNDDTDLELQARYVYTAKKRKFMSIFI